MKVSLPDIPGILWQWLAGGLVFRVLVAALLPVGFDEAYYYLYSRHLSWSYFDHPAMVALTTGIGWWATDFIAPFTLRLGALGVHTLSLLLLYAVAQYLFNEKVGILAIAIASISPIFWIAFGVLTSPDNGLICFWTLTLLIAAWEFIPFQLSSRNTMRTAAYEPSYRITLMGLTLGLTCLSKYHGFVLGAGLVGFCLTSDRTRKALWSPWTALSLLIFLLTLSPLWWWNSQNEWFSFRFHLFMRFEGDGVPNPYRPLDALGTWLLGILYLCPSIGFPLWWSTGKSLFQSVRDRFLPPLSDKEQAARDRTSLILWTALPLALGFTLLGGKQAIYPAWPAPGFWGLTILLAESAVHWRSRTIRRWLSWTGAVLGGLVVIALLHLSVGILQKPGLFSPFGGVLPVEQDGSTTLLDAVQLRSHFSQMPDLVEALEATDFVFTDEFYLSGYVDMALHPLNDKPITCFSQDPRGFAFWDTPERWLGQTALYVTLASLHRDEAALVEEFQPYFQTLEPIGEIPLTRGGTPTETVLVYRATNMQQPYPYPYP